MTMFDNRTFAVQLAITMRLATRADLPKLEWYGQYTHYRMMYRRTYHEQQEGNRLMLVADCQGFPIGQVFIQLRSRESRMAQTGQRAYLYALRVMEMFRGSGIGTRLLTEAEALVKARHYRTTTIAAAKDNPKARRLYERLGYRVFAEDDGRWSYRDHRNIVQYVDEPCWLLEKRLGMR
jgi:ribosomal protein S18 acetylase RimI-like enzyme